MTIDQPYDKYAKIYIQALNDYMGTKPLRFFQSKYEQKLYDLGRFLGSAKK